MRNARLVTLFAAVLLAVSATAAPCKPCNSGPRHNNLLPLPVLVSELPASGGTTGIGPPAAATNHHLGDLADAAEGKKYPLETLVGHAKGAGDVFKASADAMIVAVPDAAKDLVPGAALAEGNAVNEQE